MSPNAFLTSELSDVRDNHLEVISSLLVSDRPLPDLIFDIKRPILHAIRLCQRIFIGVISEMY